MTHRWRTYTLSAVALLGLLVCTGLASTAWAQDVNDANAFEKSATASTAAEHQALAAYFKDKAAQAGKEADLHTKMLAAAMNGKNYSAMQPHCKTLVQASQESQKAYTDLADLHSKLAQAK